MIPRSAVRFPSVARHVADCATVKSAVTKWWSVRLEIEGSLVQASPEALCYVLDQDTLSSALYWFNPGKTVDRDIKKQFKKKKLCRSRSSGF